MCREQLERQFWHENNYAGLYTEEEQEKVNCVKLFLVVMFFVVVVLLFFVLALFFLELLVVRIWGFKRALTLTQSRNLNTDMTCPLEDSITFCVCSCDLKLLWAAQVCLCI